MGASRYKSTVTGTDINYNFVVRCDDLLELVNGELSNSTAADLFDHGAIIRLVILFSNKTNRTYKTYRTYGSYQSYQSYILLARFSCVKVSKSCVSNLSNSSAL